MAKESTTDNNKAGTEVAVEGTEAPEAGPAKGNGAGAQLPIQWNTTNLTSSYANFCNANSTREEVVLNFGVNKSWERGPQSSSVEIELNHRIVLSPFAAKRLSGLLQQLVKEYEGRYGALSE